MLVLLAGFPDDNISCYGQETIDHFANYYYIISVCLPGYATKKGRPWGYDFSELVKMLNDTIEFVLTSSSSKHGINKLYMIGHDWGAYIAQLYQQAYPDNIIKLCLIDVAVSDDLPKAFGLCKILCIYFLHFFD